MKYIDERIEFEITVPGTVSQRPEKGMYVYKIFLYDKIQGSNQIPFFVGNLYYNKNQYLKIDVTDIIRNKWFLTNTNRNYITQYNTNIVSSYEKTIGEYWVTVEFGGTTGTLTSTHEIIPHVWRYPNRSEYNSTLDGSLTFFNADFDVYQNKFTLLLLGERSSYNLPANKMFDLIPHYPLKYTNNLSVALGFEVGKSVSDISLIMTESPNNDYATTFIIDNHNNDNAYDVYWYAPISEVAEDILYEMSEHQFIPTQNPYLIIDNNTYERRHAIVAEFDICPARYYLQWRDRFGSYQCLPFKDNGTYSEDIANSQFITYDDKSRKYNVQVQPKWKINSNWISERDFIYYESIFVSPILYLYDTQTDMGYEVKIDSKWTEKNYKNQKNLLKLELELEAVEKQNINY